MYKKRIQTISLALGLLASCGAAWGSEGVAPTQESRETIATTKLAKYTDTLIDVRKQLPFKYDLERQTSLGVDSQKVEYLEDIYSVDPASFDPENGFITKINKNLASLKRTRNGFWATVFGMVLGGTGVVAGIALGALSYIKGSLSKPCSKLAALCLKAGGAALGTGLLGCYVTDRLERKYAAGINKPFTDILNAQKVKNALADAIRTGQEKLAALQKTKNTIYTKDATKNSWEDRTNNRYGELVASYQVTIERLQEKEKQEKEEQEKEEQEKPLEEAPQASQQ